jgi:hypothetical protein
MLVTEVPVISALEAALFLFDLLKMKNSSQTALKKKATYTNYRQI